MRISDWSSDVCSSDLGSVRVVAGSIALLPCGAEVVAGVAVAVGIFDIAGVVVVRRRIDVDVAFLAVGTNDVDALAVVTFHIGNRRRAVSFHGTFGAGSRSEEHVSELQSLMRISYAVFCLK